MRSSAACRSTTCSCSWSPWRRSPSRRTCGWVVGWAIGAALALRVVFIVAGSALLGAAGWTAYVFAVFLIVAGVKLAKGLPSAADPAGNPLVRAVARIIPTVPAYAGRRLLVRRGRRLHATPLLTVLLVLAATDVAFAADSIPSIFAVTRDPVIVFAANVMALVGLPSLFVLLEGACATASPISTWAWRPCSS